MLNDQFAIRRLSFVIRISPFLLIVATAALGQENNRIGVDWGLRHEAGVETRLLLTGLAEYRLCPRFVLSGLGAWAGLDNPGIARYGLAAGFQFWEKRATIELELMHEEWSDWQTAENRLLGIVDVQPMARLGLGAGAAWRCPVIGPGRYHSPFLWQSAAAELNLAYRLWWEFLNRPAASAAVYLANADRFSFHTPQQLPLGLRLSIRRGPNTVSAQLGTALVGLSGLLLSWTELSCHLGMSREF